MTYTKYQAEFESLCKNIIPSYYYYKDKGNFKKYINAAYSVFAGIKTRLEDFSSQKDGIRASNEDLINIANNFGIIYDRNFIDKQRNFIQLASKWIDRKGVKIAYQIILASYGYDSDIEEMYQYYPKVGDADLLCGLSNPSIICGTDNIIPDNNDLKKHSKIKSLIKVKIKNYETSESIVNESLYRLVKSVTPIHIEVLKEFESWSNL